MVIDKNPKNALFSSIIKIKNFIISGLLFLLYLKNRTQICINTMKKLHILLSYRISLLWDLTKFFGATMLKKKRNFSGFEKKLAPTLIKQNNEYQVDRNRIE